VHKAFVAVTVTVRVNGVTPGLVVVKAGIGDAPEPSGKPVSTPPLHTKVSPPKVDVVRLIGPTVTPVPVATLAIGSITGIGLTVIVKDCVDPTHAPEEGVTTIVAVTGELPEFKAVNDAIFPTPLAGKPIEGVSFVQL
jgi:hypothetical protein